MQFSPESFFSEWGTNELIPSEGSREGVKEAEEQGGSEMQPFQEGDRELTGEMAFGESRAGALNSVLFPLERETSSSRMIDKRLEVSATR